MNSNVLLQKANLMIRFRISYLHMILAENPLPNHNNGAHQPQPLFLFIGKPRNFSFFLKKKKNYRGKGEKIKESCCRMKVESNGEEREGRLFCLTSELPLLHVQTFKKGSHSIHGFHLTLQGQYITSGLFKQIFNPNPLSSWYNPLQLHDLLLHL